MTMVRFSLFCLSCFAQTCLAATFEAPLPPAFVSEHDDEGEKDYWLPPAPIGIYGHGYLSSAHLDLTSEPICVGSAEEQKSLLDRVPGGDAGGEFWFYATRSQAVLFTRHAQIESKQPCNKALSFRFDVERAFVVDGMIHNGEGGDGELEMLGTRSATVGDGEYSGGFDTLHNLMARPGPPDGPVKRTDRIAGLRARCAGMSGLVWNNVCVSVTPGPTYGMLLRSAAGDDERTFFQLRFEVLHPKARLDGRLWQLDREWRLKD